MFPSIDNPNDEIKKTQKILFGLFVVALVLAIPKFAASIVLGIAELLILLTFLCGICYYNYCLIVFYIVMLLFSVINFTMFIGRTIQISFDGKNPLLSEGVFLMSFIIACVTVVYDLIALHFCFTAYKEFKGETVRQGKDVEKDGVHPTQHLKYK